MRVFLDTNVILEFFLDREEGKTAERLLNSLREKQKIVRKGVGSSTVYSATEDSREE